jgi:hypothetical protein
MAAFKKKSKPLSERSRALNAEIAALESQIKRLSHNLEKKKTEKPNPRSSPFAANRRGSQSNGSTEELVFEATDQYRLTSPFDSTHEPHPGLDLGASQSLSWMQRLKGRFRKQPPVNPKLISYLAAGSFQGLPPLRYEKRVARNRVLLLFLVLLLGILAILYKGR